MTAENSSFPHYAPPSHQVMAVSIDRPFALDGDDYRSSICQKIGRAYDNAAAIGSKVIDTIPLAFSNDYGTRACIFLVVAPLEQEISDFVTPAPVEPEYFI